MLRSPDVNDLFPKKDIPLFCFFHELVHIVKKHPLEWEFREGISEEEADEVDHEHHKGLNALALILYLTYRAGPKIPKEANKST